MLRKILLLTSVAITLPLALTFWLLDRYAITGAAKGMEDEVRSSFHSYESLWKSRASALATVSRVISGMSDVRAAFRTKDEATIRDNAGELWSRVSDEGAIFLVTDPKGKMIASLGGSKLSLPAAIPEVRAVAGRFPGQVEGFLVESGRLYQIVMTPVYVQSGGSQPLPNARQNALSSRALDAGSNNDQANRLLNVLVAGYLVDEGVARGLKNAAGGSDFLFRAGGRTVAATLEPRLADPLMAASLPPDHLQSVRVGQEEFAVLSAPLADVNGEVIGQLRIARTFTAANQRLAALQKEVFLIWIAVVALTLALGYFLARRLIGPLRQLDGAATEISKGNYDTVVKIHSRDEIGRLGQTFNAMCASIRAARQELIRHERISTIGRLSSSIVHDLRNPLAAIYGGAEMLVDADLPPQQTRRLASNIYKASRQIREMLQDLLDVSRGKVRAPEVCRLADVVQAACDAVAPLADSHKVAIQIDIPNEIELPLERNRMERVFLNLASNALEAMPDGGELHIGAVRNGSGVIVSVADTGTGIAPELRHRLFDPLVNSGKRNGLGLGLAFARQTVLDHGGDLWVDSGESGIGLNHSGSGTNANAGSTFLLRLPVDGSKMRETKPTL